MTNSARVHEHNPPERTSQSCDGKCAPPDKVRSHLSWSFPSLGCRGAMLSTALLHLCPLATAVPSPTPCECGRSDAKASTCSVEQFLDATYFWDSVDPIPVDPNCAKDPYSAMGSEIIQGFKISDDGNYSIIQPVPLSAGHLRFALLLRSACVRAALLEDVPHNGCELSLTTDQGCTRSLLRLHQGPALHDPLHSLRLGPRTVHPNEH